MNTNLTMHKNKQKQPPKNFFRYFVDEYILFRRDFEIETTASVEECSYQLSKLSSEEEVFLSSRRITSSLSQSQIPTIQHFAIKTEVRAKNGYFLSASAAGSIEQLDNGRTRLSGKILMSGRQVWMTIAFLGIFVALPVFVISMSTDKLKLLAILGFFLLVGVNNWLTMYRDRNYLLQCIQNAIHNAEMEASMSKAKDEDLYSQQFTEAQDNSTSSRAKK